MKKLLLAGALSALALGLAACEKQGPMESAGEKMDDAVEEVREGVEETGEAIQDNTEQMADGVGVTIEEAPAPDEVPQE
jgi:hypothetical protein